VDPKNNFYNHQLHDNASTVLTATRKRQKLTANRIKTLKPITKKVLIGE